MTLDLDRLAAEATSRMVQHDRLLHETMRPCTCERCRDDVQLHELLRLARVGAAYLAHEAAARHLVAADDDAVYEAAGVAYRALRDAYRACKEHP